MLEWKKVHENIKFSLGTISFKQSIDSSDSLKKFLITCVSNFKFLFCALENNKKDCCELRKANQALVTDLEKCTQLKNNLQTELMSKFVLVINEKKEKIRSLQKQLSYKSNFIVETKKVNDTNKDIVSLTTVKDSHKSNNLKSDLDEDIEPIVPKRKRYATKDPVAVSVSPVKAKELASVSPVKFPSDANATTSSDSTVDINELLEDV